ncbi:MAG: glycosyltransferase, partial [Gaiellaceae bacterium]
MPRPSVLFVGRTRYRLPLSPSLRKKFDALATELDAHVLAAAAPGSAVDDGRFTLVRPFPLRRLDGLVFWLALPWRVAALLRKLRPDAVVCQTAYDAAAALVARRIARVPARVVVVVHPDWRPTTRLYGAPSRRALGGRGVHVAPGA